MRTLDDDILERHGDLIKEVPEAERAIRDYRILSRKEEMKAVQYRICAAQREIVDRAWEDLRRQMRAAGIGSDSVQ